MSLLNPSFEDPGLLPGEAAHWTLTGVTSLEAIAGFGTHPEEAWEDFERWHTLRSTLDDVTVVLGFFDEEAKGHEGFDDGWANAVYLLELPPGQLATCAFGSGAAEDCETGWSNLPYWRDWADLASATGVFDGEPHEDFEDGWRLNEAYARAWPDVTSTMALFDGGQQGVEAFAASWTAATTQ